MVPVLARLLEFSPSELQRIQSKAAASSAGSFFSMLPTMPCLGAGGGSGSGTAS